MINIMCMTHVSTINIMKLMPLGDTCACGRVHNLKVSMNVFFYIIIYFIRSKQLTVLYIDNLIPTELSVFLFVAFYLKHETFYSSPVY